MQAGARFGPERRAESGATTASGDQPCYVLLAEVYIRSHNRLHATFLEAWTLADQRKRIFYVSSQKSSFAIVKVSRIGKLRQSAPLKITQQS